MFDRPTAAIGMDTEIQEIAFIHWNLDNLS